jgi:hypothetical protein
MRRIRIAGAIILAFSLIYSAVTGDWPSGRSTLMYAVAGVLGGVAGGLAIRAAVPRERRREFIRNAYPRIGRRLPPLSSRDELE